MRSGRGSGVEALGLALALSLGLARGASATTADSAAVRPLSLGGAVSVASGEAPTVEIAMLREHEADARVGQERAALLPSLTGTAMGLDRTFNSASFGIKFPAPPGEPGIPALIGPYTNVDARLGATQTLFNWSHWKKMSAARSGVVASQAERSGTVEAASLTAAVAYLRAARAQALALARVGDLGLAQELVDLAGVQVAAGVAPQLDQTRASTRLAAARGLLIAAETLRDRTQIELARALGLDPATRFALTDTLSNALGASATPEDEQAAIALALKQRPELAAESARRAKTREEKSAISAERIPHLDLAADYGVNGLHVGDAIGTGEVSLAVTMPLLDGWSRESRIDEHNASIRESEVREHDLRDQAAAEVSASLLDLRSGIAQESVADERLALAERELLEARDRFESGIAGNLDVINAQTGLVAARDAEIDARFAIALARVTLARAAGSAHTLH